MDERLSNHLLPSILLSLALNFSILMKLKLNCTISGFMKILKYTKNLNIHFFIGPIWDFAFNKTQKDLVMATLV